MASGRASIGVERGWSGTRLRVWPLAATVLAGGRPPGEKTRPAIFTLLFWMVPLAALAAQALFPAELPPRVDWPVLAIATVVLVASWQALPWDRRAGARRKALAVVFLGAALGFGYLSVFLWGLALYPIAVANAVFLFGYRRGIAFAAASLPLAWVSVYASDPAAFGIGGASFMTALVVPMVVFMIGICQIVIDAERNRAAAEALLGNLESAHAALQRQTARVRHLAIAEERARLAREVHDDLGHHLTAINLLLQNAERFAERDPERSRGQVCQARETTLSALAEVRRAVRALKPSGLGAQDVVAALAGVARSFDGTGPKVSFHHRGEHRTLPDAVELVLYRATQEGLTNAAKHAGARQIDVRLVVEPDTVRLEVTDDGAGAGAGPLDGGFGLAAPRERVDALGGTLTVGDRPGGGFALAIVLPAGVPGAVGTGDA